MEEKKKDLVWLPVELCEKIKEIEKRDDLVEKEIIAYIEKTRKDITGQIECMDEDVLMFKGAVASFKKKFKEAYESADTEMYSFWETVNGDQGEKLKAINDRTDRFFKDLDKQIERRSKSIESLQKSMKEVNVYQFERIMTFLHSFENLGEKTQNLFLSIIKKGEQS